MADFAVVICTRNRPSHLARTLDALERQSDRDFATLVVDQSDEPAQPRAGVEILADEGRGLSRARNVAWRRLEAEWLVFVDDDCIVEEDWAASLRRELDAHPEAAFVSGHVAEHDTPDGDYLAVTAFPVDRPRLRSGRWTRPWEIGFGVCMAVRRSAIESLGGWDERLGVGSDRFGAAEDMDFNYRFLRSGGVAYATPSVRALHDQWRTREELAPLYGRYMAGWCAFAMKQLKTGDVAGGLWLWLLGLHDALRMLASSARRRSRLRFSVARAKLRGLVTGTREGLGQRW